MGSALGETFKFWVTARDTNGSATVPTGLRLLLWKPITTASAVYYQDSGHFTNAATGAYSINLRLGETGTWYFRWETNSNAHIDGSVIITGSRFYPSGTA